MEDRELYDTRLIVADLGGILNIGKQDNGSDKEDDEDDD